MILVMRLNYPYYTLLIWRRVVHNNSSSLENRRGCEGVASSANRQIFGAFIAIVSHMVMRIEKSRFSKFVIFTLSGRIENEKIRELQEILALEQANQKIAFDLKDVKLVDQHSVEFLEECEAQGAELWNCPPYLREWIVRVRAKKVM